MAFSVHWLLLSSPPAVPAHNPYITGQKTRYSPGEVVDLNCTANSSDPVADLFWYINSEAVSIVFLYDKLATNQYFDEITLKGEFQNAAYLNSEMLTSPWAMNSFGKIFILHVQELLS